MHFQAKLAKSYKIAISPTAKIELTPNFDRVIEPHTWVHGPDWQFQFNMTDGRHIGKCWKCYNSPTNGPIWTKVGWSHPIMSRTCPSWYGCYGNGRWLATAHWTLNVRGVWGPNAWTDFDEIRYTTADLVLEVVTWRNMKIFKTQNGGRPPSWKSLSHTISTKNIRFWWNLGVEAGCVSQFRWNLGGQISLRRRSVCVGWLLWRRPSRSNSTVNVMDF